MLSIIVIQCIAELPCVDVCIHVLHFALYFTGLENKLKFFPGTSGGI